MNTSMDKAYARRWWVLVVLNLSVFLVVVDNLIVNVALPTLQRELNASTTGLQWIVDSYSLVFAGLLLAGGIHGCRVGFFPQQGAERLDRQNAVHREGRCRLERGL